MYLKKNIYKELQNKDFSSIADIINLQSYGNVLYKNNKANGIVLDITDNILTIKIKSKNIIIVNDLFEKSLNINEDINIYYRKNNQGCFFGFGDGINNPYIQCGWGIGQNSNNQITSLRYIYYFANKIHLIDSQSGEEYLDSKKRILTSFEYCQLKPFQLNQEDTHNDSFIFNNIYYADVFKATNSASLVQDFTMNGQYYCYLKTGQDNDAAIILKI